MTGRSLISPEVLGRYAADAARAVPGVDRLIGRHDGVKVSNEDDRVSLELHVALEAGANAVQVGSGVQAQVAESLERLANVRPATVDVIVAEWRSASPG